MGKQNIIEIDGTTIRETEAAILFNDGELEEWLPKSQLEDWPDVGGTGAVVMPEWLAKDKGFI
jgi:hypothetical protein